MQADNSCCAMQQLQQAQQAQVKTHNFQHAFPSAVVVDPAVQLDDISSMSSSSMSTDHPPLILIVATEPTDNKFINNYNLDRNDNDYSLTEKLSTSLVDMMLPLNIGKPAILVVTSDQVSNLNA